MSFLHILKIITLFCFLFKESFQSSSGKKEVQNLTIQWKNHSDITSFYQPLIEFNHGNCSELIDGDNYCILVHPKSKKEVKFEHDKEILHYFLDGFNHTITQREYFGSNPAKNCEVLSKLKELENSGDFLEEEAEIFCSWSKCHNEVGEKLDLCMNEKNSKKEEMNEK